MFLERVLIRMQLFVGGSSACVPVWRDVGSALLQTVASLVLQVKRQLWQVNGLLVLHGEVRMQSPLLGRPGFREWSSSVE